MAKYKKISVIIDAEQWFKNGDHSGDFCVPIKSNRSDKKILMSEGQVVRYFRHPDIDGQKKCEYCGQKMHFHGWIDTVQGGHIVCLGDWIIKEQSNIKKGFYPCKPDIFKQTYEKV